MNNVRRKKIENLICWLKRLENDFEESLLDDCIGRLDDIKNEEEEAFENMPEGLQYSARGMDSETAIDNLDEALSYLEELYSTEDIEERIEKIEMAIDCLEDAKMY